MGGGSGRGCFFGRQLIRTMSSAWSCQPSELIRKCWSTPNFVSNIIRGVGKLFTKTEQDVALQEFEAKLNRPRL